MAPWYKNLFRGTLPSTGTPLSSGIASTFGGTPMNIRDLAFSDFFQGELAQSSRGEAMQIPAISRARSILVGVVAGLPLRAYDTAGNELPEQPAWLTATKSPTPLWHRMAWTLDDLLFSGASLWQLERDGDAVIDAARVPRDRWEVNEQSDEILIDGKPVYADSVMYIPGADEGVLAKAGPSIRGARAIERAWIGRAQNPIPLIELHNTGDDELDDDEIDNLVNAWASARTSPTGAVGYTDSRVEVRVHGTVATDMFLEARNATVLDLARHTNFPAAILDGSMSTASLTYSTVEGKANEFWDYTIPLFTAPIEARLSQDDITPEGVAIRFDRSAAVRTPQPITAPITDD